MSWTPQIVLGLDADGLVGGGSTTPRFHPNRPYYAGGHYLVKGPGKALG
jgi:hypothetical protein